MTTTSISQGFTIDRLADPDKRKIETIFETAVTTTDSLNGVGKIQIAVETSFSKARKKITTTIHTQTATERGFTVRSFVLYGPPSTDFGWTIFDIPTARFSQKAARELHAVALEGIEFTIADLAAQGGVWTALVEAWESLT
jgi:hypothetical protein